MLPVRMFCLVLVVAGFSACRSTDPTSGAAADTTGASSGSQNSGCGTLTNVGQCDGTTVIWCESGAVKSVNCKKAGYAGCQLVSGIYDCYGKADNGLKACLASCSTGCDQLPCKYTGAAMSQCTLDRANCKLGCPCDCASSIKPSTSAEATACSTSCQKVCSVAASKCQAGCGGNNACASKCSGAMSECLSGATSVCF